MSITRLQQARQMYAMGQRVGRAFGGVMGPDGRKAYVGGSYSDNGGYQGGSGAPGSAESSGGGKGGSGNGGSGNGNGGGGDPPVTAQNIDDIVLTGKDYKRARRDFDVGVAGGYAKDSGNMFVGPMPYGTTIDPYQKFRSNRPKVNIPNFGLSGMFLNLFNKGVNSPIQKFADFTTAKNRNFFENVIRAGKIPGLDFGTVADMTPEQLENAYGSYMDNRMSGATDAYGNPIGNQSGEGIQTIPLQYGMFSDNSDEAEGIETVANDRFVSRYLQNQPDNIRENIEANMQDYYTV